MVFYSAHDRHGHVLPGPPAKPLLDRDASSKDLQEVRTDTGRGVWVVTPNPNKSRADRDGCGCCSGAPNWQPSYTIRGASARSAPRPSFRGPPRAGVAATRSLGRGGRHRPLRQVRERRRAHPCDVHRGPPIGDYPNSDLVRVVGPAPAPISRASGRPRRATRRRAAGQASLNRVRANSTATSSGRSISPSGPRSGRSSSTMRRTLRPEYWWARFDGQRWRKLPDHPLRPHTPRVTGPTRLSDARQEDPSIVYLSRA